MSVVLWLLFVYNYDSFTLLSNVFYVVLKITKTVTLFTRIVAEYVETWDKKKLEFIEICGFWRRVFGIQCFCWEIKFKCFNKITCRGIRPLVAHQLICMFCSITTPNIAITRNKIVDCSCLKVHFHKIFYLKAAVKWQKYSNKVQKCGTKLTLQPRHQNSFLLTSTEGACSWMQQALPVCSFKLRGPSLSFALIW